RDLIAANARSPWARPSPRKEWPDVRFALSYDALKMNGTPSRRVTSTRRIAKSRAWRSLSITHGPAMRTNGLPPPIARPFSLIGITEAIIRGRSGRERPLLPTYATDAA